MCYKADNTKTKVKEDHVDDVHQILDAYELKGIAVELLEKNKGWVLSWSEEFPEKDVDVEDLEDVEGGDELVNDSTGYMRSWSDSPQAIRRVDIPSRDQYPDEKEWDDARFLYFLRNGHDGFLKLLGELAAHLETPMTVLVLSITSEDRLEWDAEVYAVQPGQTDVQTVVLGQP